MITSLPAWVQEKVNVWTGELSTLSELSKSSPQAVFSALTHGWFGHWTYLCRTCPNIGPLIQPIEDALRHQIYPSLTSSDAPTDNYRELFSLPSSWWSGLSESCLCLLHPILKLCLFLSLLLIWLFHNVLRYRSTL